MKTVPKNTARPGQMYIPAPRGNRWARELFAGALLGLMLAAALFVMLTVGAR